MNGFDRDIVALRADHDQDVENALRWWTEHDGNAKLRIAEAIAALCDDDRPAEEQLVGRFAQLGITEILLRAHDREQPLTPES